MNPYYLTDEWKELRRQVVARDNGTCFYCDDPGFQADHIVPRTYGGRDQISNLVCCCARCNKLLLASFFVTKSEKRRWIQAKIHGNKYVPRVTRKRNLFNGMKPWEYKSAQSQWPTPEERNKASDAKLKKWLENQSP
jgi:hypothetical protein